MANLSEKDIDEIDDRLGVLDDTGGLKPAVNEGEDFKSAYGVEFIGGDGVELFGEGGVDDDQVVEILLVGLKFNREEVTKQLHPLELVVESTVLRVKKKPEHLYFLYSISENNIQKQIFIPQLLSNIPVPPLHLHQSTSNG